MSTRVLYAVGLALMLALCSCSGPTGPSNVTYYPQGQAQTSPPPPETINVEGEYSLTIRMSPSCSLPSEVMQRTYTATIREPRKGYVTVTLSGADFAMVEPPYYKAGFEGARNGDAVRFVVVNEYGGEYSLTESIDGKLLNIEGVADTSIADSSIEGYFAGDIRYFAPGSGLNGSLGQCTASDHRMVFTRK